MDYGADINKLNCEGLSALAACHVLFYTKHTWKGNIAETLPEENVFNSVRWNISSGTFVQRKNRGSLSLIKPQVSESESQFSLDTPNVMSQEYLGKSFSHIEIDGSKLGNVSDLTVCRIDKGNRDGKKYTETTGYSGSKNQDKNGKFINEQHKRSSENEEDGSNFKNETNEKCMENLCSGRDLEHENRSGLDNVSGNIDQISTSLVDKNIFIHEFLNRTASAMSNRNSSVSHEKVQSVLDNSLDNKKLVTTDAKSENSDALLEENNIKNTVEKVGSSELAVISYEPPGSLQYSVLSAIGSSQQTSTYLEASDGLNILEQNRQKLLTQQR